MFPETFRVIWRNGPNFQKREAWAEGVYNAPSYETNVPNFPWCSAFVVFISILIGSQNICVKTREQKNRNKTVSERTTWQRSGYLWNISVVVCNLAGLDKNWTDFKKKKRTASKASATGMILVHSGFSVSSWCSGSTRQSQKLRIFSPVKSDCVWVWPTKSKSWRSLLMNRRS